MPTVLLLRHGLTAMTGPRLAGWTPGVELDERGHAQAAAVAERLRPLPFAAVVSSPLDRCLQTAAAVAAGRDLTVAVEARLGECRYGDWTGRELKTLAKDPLWQVVQAHPSAAVFPGPEGEPLRVTQARAVAAVREGDAAVEAEHGPDAVWVACSHGDVIKGIVADALGLHLDLFQRLVVDPCSLTVIRYTPLRPFVLRVNDTGGEIASLMPPKRRRRRGTGGRRASAARLAAQSAAPVGGGTGSAGTGTSAAGAAAEPAG